MDRVVLKWTVRLVGVSQVFGGVCAAVGGREVSVADWQSVAMATWSVEHRVFAVEEFIRNNESIVAVTRAFRRRFNIPPRGSVPKRDRILSWVHNFRTTGSCAPQWRPRPRTIRTPENVEHVRRDVITSPRRSTRRRAQALGMSRRSLQRILKQELKFHPYKIMVVQKILPTDHLQRLQFSQRMLELLEDENLIMMMSDEAHFHIDGYVNKQNCRYWADTNPRELHESPLHSDKVTVWCGVSKVGIIGPYFFENEREQAVTVNSQRYVNMIEEFLVPQLEENNYDMNNMWFQQDGATAHTARISMQAVRVLFPGRLISRNGDVHWPPRSPDLTVCDFFLWGYLKARVYRNIPRTIQELKAAIHNEITSIPGDVLQRAMRNVRDRLQECVARDGGHLMDVIFKK